MSYIRTACQISFLVSSLTDCIYLNDRHTWIEQHETLAEEIGHYATSSGNIVDYSTVESRKQERRARDYGYQLTVTLGRSHLVLRASSRHDR
jgi:hypothetical protein